MLPRLKLCLLLMNELPRLKLWHPLLDHSPYMEINLMPVIDLCVLSNTIYTVPLTVTV
jgi:hypothetical protein